MGSSKQVTGYRYYAFFLLFIGNPIEKVLGINFDKRGWKTPLIDEQKNPLTIGWVKEANLYGENEGGVAGQIHARYGTADQKPVSFYADHLAENDLPPIAYPYQSYLAFPDFYLGNSGYMKEMLLWPKRIHVRNDGRAQWYDAKSAIDSFNRYELAPHNEYRSFQVLNKMTMKWSDPTGEYTYHAGGAAFPMTEVGQSYAAGAGYNGDVLPEPPGIIAAAPVLSAANMPADIKEGVILPPATWTSYPPSTDGFYNGAVTRHFWATGRFMWGGGLFKYRTVLSKNGAQILISAVVGDKVALKHTIQNTTNDNYKYLQGELDLPVGMYELQANIGERYFNQGTPRPFLHLQVNAKSVDSIDAPDINPIHKIREILTDDTAMNKPESDVNNVNFAKAADRIWDEGLGVSWAITEKSCLEAINELCGHIEAGVRVNRQTGLYEMVLFRDDWFEENEIYTIAVNKIKSMSLEVANADEAINQLNVTYYNRGAIKDSSFSIAENASIRNLNGRVNAEDADFPYFMNQRNAAVVAQWKLKQMSSPVWKGSFTTAEYNARKWNRYDLLKLAWPRKWQGTITVRIMKINLGIGTDVSIDFVEVVPYSSNLSSNIVIDEPIDVAPQPPLACQYEPFEMPYYLAVMALGQRQVDEELSYENNFGLAAVVAEKPQSNSLYAVMMTHNGTEGEEWLRAATINYEPVADLDQIISKTSTNFTVKNNAAIAELPVNTLIKCGGEWMVFSGIDQETGVVSVKRGALDTLPQECGIGTKLYFCGNDVAFDSTKYIAGEEILVSALTTTPSGMLENKGSITIEMNARAFRPYPPANVKINGEYWPKEIEGNLRITWAHRNRKQQTGGNALSWFDGDVTKEEGVTYSLLLKNSETLAILYSQDGIFDDNVTIDESNLAQNCILELWSMRNGFESFTRFIHTFRTLASAPKWTPENLTKTPTAKLYSDQNLTVNESNKVTNWGGFFTASNGPTLREDLLPFPVLLNEAETSQMVAANFALNVMDSEIWTFGVYYRDSIEYKRLFDIALDASTNGAVTAYLGNNGLIVGVTGRISTFSLPVTATQSKVAASNLTMVFTRIKWIAGTAVEISVDGQDKVVNTGLSPSSLKPTTQQNLCLGYPQVKPGQTGQSINSGYVSFVCGNSTSTPGQEQIDRLFGWAAHKYGIADQLPASHPYKSSAPTI